jgi:hypothetical protein
MATGLERVRVVLPAQRLPASRMKPHYHHHPARRSVRVVLNAFRHHRSLHLKTTWTIEAEQECSTPSGITDRFTPSIKPIYFSFPL